MVILLTSFVACWLGCGNSQITLADLEAAAESIQVTEVAAVSATDASAPAAILDIEKPDLKFGFIKLTDLRTVGDRQRKRLLR